MPDSIPVTWTPAREIAASDRPALWPALKRGLTAACPVCGKGHLFSSFIRPSKTCASCNAPLGRVPADDVPPYVTIMIVGHIVVPLMLLLERTETPPLWVHTIIWVPLTLALTIGLLRPVKGAVMGLMLHLGMPRPEGDA